MNAIEEDAVESEDYEPLVTSSNPTERILARRLRIERRVEALRKEKEAQEVAKEDAGAEGETAAKTPIEAQVEKSLDLLERLILEGDEYITNVRVATEAREADRREREGFGKEKLLKELEDEAQAAETMFNEIANKWIGILKYNDPLHINEEIMGQKEKCDELIRQKDAIIADLKGKLKNAEIDFSRDQRKQIEDINSIARRIENQIIVMRKAYRQELQMIEDVVSTERQILIESNNKKWEELYKKRDQEEKINSEKKSEDFWSFFKEMDDLNRDFQEVYRETNIKLENDCDELQRELERIKTDAVMNSEKLDYNYQILKKREDENLIIRSQQKRRINKLQDVVNSLRKKNNDYHKNTSLQIEKLTEEIKKLNQNILDIENKADHMAKVNNMKFESIWKMNSERVTKLFKRILDIDQTLYKQQLGIEWKAPPCKMPSKTDLETIKALSNKDKETDQDEEYSLFNDEFTGEENLRYKQLVNHILNLVADKTGFLVEDQLNTILGPYLDQQKALIKVDNVFSALNVTERNDMDLLLQYFLPYMYCPVCCVSSDVVMLAEEESLMKVHDIDPLTFVELAASKSMEAQDDILEAYMDSDPGGTEVDLGPLTVTLFDSNLAGECKGPVVPEEKKIHDSTESLTDTSGRDKIPCQYQHPLVISSVYVLKALKEFLARYHVPKTSLPTMVARLSHKRNTFSRSFAATDVESYWKKFREMLPIERVQIWDRLSEGLKKYHELLKARKAVSEEVLTLRQQNADLRRVFANYIDTKDIPY